MATHEISIFFLEYFIMNIVFISFVIKKNQNTTHLCIKIKLMNQILMVEIWHSVSESLA